VSRGTEKLIKIRENPNYFRNIPKKCELMAALLNILMA
jgi:hypothetical protein